MGEMGIDARDSLIGSQHIDIYEHTVPKPA